MTFDRAKATDILTRLSDEHWDYWDSHGFLHFTAGVPYAKATSTKDGTMQVQVSSFGDDNHAPIKEAAFISSSSDRATDLYRMLTACAPILGTPGMAVQFDFVRGRKPSLAGQGGDGPFATTRVHFATIELLEVQAQKDNADHMTPAEVASALGDLAESLSCIEVDEDRLFQVNTAQFNAASPEDALYIFDRISGMNLMAEEGLQLPTVHEVFDPFIAQFDMRERYGRKPD